MEKIQKFVLLALILFPSIIMAQRNQQPTRSFFPDVIPEKGHWAIETNLKNLSHTIVYYYLDGNKLIAKEEINDMVIDIKNIKTKLWLKARLDEEISEYEVGSGIGLVD